MVQNMWSQTLVDYVVKLLALEPDIDLHQTQHCTNIFTAAVSYTNSKYVVCSSKRGRGSTGVSSLRLPCVAHALVVILIRCFFFPLKKSQWS